MTNKKRVNWTIDPYCIRVLKQAQKDNGRRDTSLSDLVEFAIRKTYQNKTEFYREKMRELQKKLVEYKDKLNMLEEANKNG